MRDETLALHCGFDADPATKAVAETIRMVGIQHRDIIADLDQAGAMRVQLKVAR